MDSLQYTLDLARHTSVCYSTILAKSPPRSSGVVEPNFFKSLLVRRSLGAPIICRASLKGSALLVLLVVIGVSYIPPWLRPMMVGQGGQQGC